MTKAHTLVSLLDSAVEKYGSRTAVKSQVTGENWIYEQLRENSLRVANYLVESGVGPRDMVVRISDNTPSSLAASLGINRLGATDVPINEKLTPEDLYTDYLSLIEPKAILVEGQYAAKVAQYTSSPIITINQALQSHPKEYDVEISPDDISTIIFSSGTTSESERAFKAVMLSHWNIASNVLATEHLSSRAELIDGYDQGIYLTGVGKHWHSFEYMIQRAFLHSGCLLYFTDLQRFRKGKAAEINPNYILMIPKLAIQIKREIERGVENLLRKRLNVLDEQHREEKEKTSSFKTRKWICDHVDLKKPFDWFIGNSSKFLLEKRNEHRLDLTRLALHQLGDLVFYRGIRKKLNGKFGNRKLYPIGGAASLDEEVQLFCSSVGFEIDQGYGLTETSPVICVNYPGNYKFRSSGRLIPGVEVLIADLEELKERRIKELKSGEEGVILVKGPNVFKGYYKDPKETAAAFIDDWFNTGDIGGLDKERFLYISGRAKDIIVLLNGEKPFATPIETYYAGRGIPLVLVGHKQKKAGALIIPDPDMKARISEKGLETIIAEVCKQLEDCKERFGVDLSKSCSNVAIITDFEEHPELITSTLKLRRNLFEKVYAEQIKHLCN